MDFVGPGTPFVMTPNSDGSYHVTESFAVVNSSNRRRVMGSFSLFDVWEGSTVVGSPSASPITLSSAREPLGGPPFCHQISADPSNIVVQVGATASIPIDFQITFPAGFGPTLFDAWVFFRSPSALAPGEPPCS